MKSPEPGQLPAEQLRKAEKARADRQHELWCDIQRSIRYHRARESFFQWWSNLFSFVSLMAGSGVVVSLLSKGPNELSVALGALVAGMQAIELIVQISLKSRLHNGLASEFSALARYMAKAGALTEENLRELEADILVIEAREPPIKRYLDLICHNQVASAIGSDDQQKLTFLQRRLAHWLSGDTALQN